MTAVYGSQSTPQVLVVVSTFDLVSTNTTTLSSSAFFSRLLCSVSEVEDDCCVRKPNYSSSVDGCFDI